MFARQYGELIGLSGNSSRFDSVTEANRSGTPQELKAALDANIHVLTAIVNAAKHVVRRYTTQLYDLQDDRSKLMLEYYQDFSEEFEGEAAGREREPEPAKEFIRVIDAGSGHFESRIEQAIAEANQPATPDERMGFDSEAEFKEAISRVLTRISEIANQPTPEEGPDDAE